MDNQTDEGMDREMPKEKTICLPKILGDIITETSIL
jgi:hypothetical protein